MTSYLITGEPVWAKMKGYPPWPAKIVDPPSDSKTKKKQNASYVLFFGTGDYAWIHHDNIFPHSETMLIIARDRGGNPAAYQNGIEELINYSKSYIKVEHDRVVKTEIVDNKNNINFNEESSYLPPNIPNRELYLKPSNKSFGFIGLGTMGKHIVKALLETGHKITVWDKTGSKCETFLDMGAKRARHPADLVLSCDIIFCCVADSEASKAVLFGKDGVVTGFEYAMQLKPTTRKGYVEMTTVDPDSSQEAAKVIQLKNGAYLEVPFCGTSEDAEGGQLLFLAAGDRELFSMCETIFHAIGKTAFFVSYDVGDGLKMSIILSTYEGIMCGAIAEAMTLVERLKLQKSHFLELLENGPVACKSFIDKAQKMKDLSFEKGTALKDAQKNISLALCIGNKHSQKLLITSTANETYKHGILRNYSKEDMSAVYKVIKH